MLVSRAWAWAFAALFGVEHGFRGGFGVEDKDGVRVSGGGKEREKDRDRDKKNGAKTEMNRA
jgi:hypothetical protein